VCEQRIVHNVFEEGISNHHLVTITARFIQWPSPSGVLVYSALPDVDLIGNSVEEPKKPRRPDEDSSEGTLVGVEIKDGVKLDSASTTKEAESDEPDDKNDKVEGIVGRRDVRITYYGPP
jgi:hypothetical protein